MTENTDYQELAERTHELLAGPNAPLVRRASPQQFGWRLWLISPKDHRLVSPFTFVPYDSASITAHCKHGNVIPHPDCVCGVHYVPNVVHFSQSLKAILESGGFRFRDATTGEEIPVVIPQTNVALTFGAAVGRTAYDKKQFKTWGERPMRSAEYRILHICVPDGGVSPRILEHRYNVPVTYGIDADSAIRAELRFNRRALLLEATVVAGGDG